MSSKIQFSADETFHFEILRVLAHARHGAADVNEVLLAASKIIPGDFDSWHSAFHALAVRTHARAKALRCPAAVRDAMFHAATYYRAADFYLHGNPGNPRILSIWDQAIECFDTANATLPIPGVRKLIQADGFLIPTIFFSATTRDDDTPRPTIIMGNGFDGSQEEMYHQHGIAALNRGWNVITYEGPGQCSVRRYQGLGFIEEWEKVVTPVVDHLGTIPSVDMSKIALFGNSMGGCWAGRAAAFEHRLAAVFLVDGVYDVYDAWTSQSPRDADGELLPAEKRMELIKKAKEEGTLSTTVRWAIEHGTWAFDCSAEELLDKTKIFTLKGIEDKIQCPVWVGNAVDDLFFKGQPEKVRDALGDKATYVELTEDDAAGTHCHVGAATLLNQMVYDWFEEIIARKETCC